MSKNETTIDHTDITHYSQFTSHHCLTGNSNRTSTGVFDGC